MECMGKTWNDTQKNTLEEYNGIMNNYEFIDITVNNIWQRIL